MSEIKTYDYLDACRGYAILLVMLAHTMGAFRNMPWHVVQFSNLGWNGVQLFFVVSSYTLAMSWRRRSHHDRHPYAAFLVRRFFRIAPMFYAAMLLYFVVWPPGPSFSVATAILTIAFMHGWNPQTLSTVSGGWTAVPGSWSIAAEFGFYFLFPLFITYLTTLKRSLLAFSITLVGAFFAYRLAMSIYSETYGWRASDQFAFYWLPNQLPVFCLGFAVLHVLDRWKPVRPWRGGPWMCGFLVVAFFGLDFVPFARTPELGFPFIPIHVAAALLFSLFIVGLGTSGRTLWVNRPVVMLGKVSFSVYLLHFAVIDLLSHVFNTAARNWGAIAQGACMLPAVVLLTFCIASATYAWVERPMIGVGRVVAEVLTARPETALE